MQAAAGSTYSPGGASTIVEYEAGGSARIDGTVHSSVAVEIESRTGKQVRGALVDLIFHSYRKKLLVLIPMHMHNVETVADQCRSVLKRFVAAGDFRVVVLAGTGHDPKLVKDEAVIRAALRELGCNF